MAYGHCFERLASQHASPQHAVRHGDGLAEDGASEWRSAPVRIAGQAAEHICTVSDGPGHCPRVPAPTAATVPLSAREDEQEQAPHGRARLTHCEGGAGEGGGEGGSGEGGSGGAAGW